MSTLVIPLSFVSPRIYSHLPYRFIHRFRHYNILEIVDLGSGPHLPRRPKLQGPFHQLMFFAVWRHRHTLLSQVLEYDFPTNLLSSQELLGIFTEGENSFRSL